MLKKNFGRYPLLSSIIIFIFLAFRHEEVSAECSQRIEKSLPRQTETWSTGNTLATPSG